MHSPSLFEGYSVADYPTLVERLAALPGHDIGFVYVVFWASGEVEMPFYVGETDSVSRRMGDYWSAQFGAPTDFRVGEAIRYLRDIRNCRISLKYKRSDERKQEEIVLIRKLHLSGVLLLNDLCGYDYWTANKDEERLIIQLFCDRLLRDSG
jgi:hypothetical protein